MKPEKATLLLVTSEHLREALQALLETIPKVGLIFQAESPADALLLTTQHKPNLIILDDQFLNRDLTKTVMRLKARIPPPICLVLADNRHQQAQATGAGADVTLIKGHLSTRLILTIETILGDISS